MRQVLFISIPCLALLSVGLVVKKDDPSKALQKFAEESKAVEYMDKWKDKSWEQARLSCDVDKLPKTTDNIIFNICGKSSKDGDRCICNIAKAHSCHAGCRKMGPVCPKECKGVNMGGKCMQGAPFNGGQELSLGGHNGKCYHHCTAVIGGGRFCGSGPDYKQPFSVDCTGCHPKSKEKLSKKEQKDEWISCMAGCFPTPSCTDMCSEGTPECYTNCVLQYKSVVEPYWDIFKGTLHAIPLVGEGSVGGGDVPKKEGEGEVPKKEAETLAETAPAKEEVPPKKKEEVPPKKKVVHEEHDEEEEEYDEDEEEEWVDPWAGENEWDDEDEDDDYYDDEEDYDGELSLYGHKRRNKHQNPWKFYSNANKMLKHGEHSPF